MLGFLAVVESVFILAFMWLLAQARNRRTPR